MGTNYYLHEHCCDKCGRGGSSIHIGKSSFGWCFSLHVDSDEKLNNLEDWKLRWTAPGAIIRNEYEEEIPPSKMEEVITQRMHERKLDHATAAAHRAEVGPNNLLRHRIDEYCKGHGEGPWDYIIGDFS